MKKGFLGLAVVLAGVVPSLLAGTNTVTSTADSGPGTLRAALANAANGDAIDFAVATPATITLATGELVVSNNVTILGPGSLTVDGNFPNTTNRIFHISSNIVVAISGLTITNGVAGGPSFGDASGGGILNDHATLTISNCTITGNTAVSGKGGGIFNDALSPPGATLIVINSTLSGNSASNGGFGGGGGIGSFSQNGGTAMVMIVNCTFSGNSANGGYAAYSGGGGIENFGVGGGTAMVMIVNCTFSGNSATFGGGIFNSGSAGSATLTLNASTLSGNFSTFSGADSIENISGTLEIGDTILQVGASGTNVVNSSGTVISRGYNLSSDNGGGVLTNATDQINTNPLLGPLQDNGGPTFTQALLAGSPAMDEGKRDVIPALTRNTDQRGEPRPFDDPNISNATGGDGSDIGAYEASELRIVNVQRTDNDLRLDYTSWLGTNYEVQSRSDLNSGSWDSLGVTNAGNGGVTSITISNACSVPQQFYRVHLVP